MNKLNIDKQAAVLNGLIEGCSIRSVERMTGVHRDTIMRLLVRTGEGCQSLMDSMMRDLPCRQVQVDEIWAYVGKKQRHMTDLDDPTRTGDIWRYVALDPESKLIPAYRVGKRNLENTKAFLEDLSGRLTNRVQLSSDALAHYVEAAESAFGGNVDYGQIVKVYEAEAIGPGRYSPPHVVSAEKKRINGSPDKAYISTSHVERQNLTMRMSMRRFTRLTNAFSKKLENLKAAVSLHFAHYNLCRVHKTLRVTPAMEAGISDHIWTLPEICSLID